ncbi:hypothetical protein CRI93_03810 [Longimonas halophila]|uniref:Putative restriction endonuclease domain-containing protein n=1 Tax=Longimonas halophila TaxID=1469170 RepID=A0A2H3P3P1_9BACT|nr:Uma2 family endonuclease [Longimonas halophila]PEN08882.1 hypothetical protein CRI93_03810 [Longimonas halophila]
MDTQPATAWHRALRDPHLQQLPYKVETNAHNQILLSPHPPWHSTMQVRISDMLRDRLGERGLRAVEFPVETPQGVKVPDVVWLSDERASQLSPDAEASPVMPNLVVEVLSASNTEAEMAEKCVLYFESGATEVWTCAPEGTMTFHTAPEEQAEASTLVPAFPAVVK